MIPLKKIYCLVATKLIEPGDEILFNYGDFWDTNLHLHDPSVIAAVKERYGFVTSIANTSIIQPTDKKEKKEKTKKSKKSTPSKKKAYKTKQNEKERREQKESTIREIRHQERLKETSKTSLGDPTALGNEIIDFGDPTLGTYEVLRSWLDIPDDEIESLREMYSLSEDETGKPEYFPKEIWKYVRDDDKPNVNARWALFSTERIKEIITLLPKELDICKTRPKQRQ
jgi:hypothetical protein